MQLSSLDEGTGIYLWDSRSNKMEKSYQQDQELQDCTQSILPSRFVNMGLIAQGGMGSVFRVQDKYLEREVALKLLHLDGSLDENARQRFLQEARALALLEHANIVKILGSGITDSGYPYHILEYLQGEPLSLTLQREGCLKPSDFYEIFSQVCKGLAHAHKNNIVHRDLKPSNIFLCTEVDGAKTTKIIDFGIARFSGGEHTGSQALTRTNTLIGSPAYMSPEQCRGTTADNRSDIYSLACIMYEALTGKPIFEANSALEQMYKHMNTQAPTLQFETANHGARRLADLLSTCLAKDPEKRPQTIDAVYNEMKDTFETEKVLISTDRKHYRPKRPAAMTIIVFISALILVSAAGYLGTKLLLQQNASESLKVKTSRSSPEQEKRVAYLEAGLHNIQFQLQNTQSKAEQEQLLTVLVKNTIALAEIQAKTQSMKFADQSFQSALALCKGENAFNKLKQAEIYQAMGTLHNSQESENEFKLALKLMREATDSINSPEQAPLRRAMVAYYLNTRDWDKARIEYQCLLSIWKAHLADFDEADNRRFSRQLLEGLQCKKTFTSNEDRLGAIEFTADVSEYLVLSKKDYGIAVQALHQCLEFARGFPKASSYFAAQEPRVSRLLKEAEAGSASSSAESQDE